MEPSEGREYMKKHLGSESLGRYMWDTYTDIRGYAPSFVEFVKEKIPLKSDYDEILRKYGGQLVTEFNNKRKNISEGKKEESVASTPALV